MKKLINFIICGLFSFIIYNGNAQSLTDWQYAKGKQGQESIPYSDLRSIVKDYQPIIDGCRQTPFNCDNLKTKEHIINLNYRKNTKIFALKDKHVKLYTERDNATSDSERSAIQVKIDAALEELNREIKEVEQMDTGLKAHFYEIERRIKIGTRCLEARKKVNDAFTEAIRRASNENEPQITQITPELISHWTSGLRTHNDMHANWDQAIKKCEQCRSGNL